METDTECAHPEILLDMHFTELIMLSLLPEAV